MCECVSKINEKIAPGNARIEQSLVITPDLGLKVRILIATERIDKTKRKPVPRVVASYCPFCGEELQ